MIHTVTEYRRTHPITNHQRTHIITYCGNCDKKLDMAKKDYKKRKLDFNGNCTCKQCKDKKEVTGIIPYKGTPIHNSFMGAKQRCNYKKHIAFKNYGGRGIKFLWDTFDDFFDDMHSTWFSGATIERVDTNGNYCKDNCIWTTRKKQAQNTRVNIHTQEDVGAIRKMYASGKYYQAELAQMFGDSQGNISNIILGRTW